MAGMPTAPPLCTRLPQQYLFLLVARRFMDKSCTRVLMAVFASFFFSSLPNPAVGFSADSGYKEKLPCLTKCLSEYHHMEVDLYFFFFLQQYGLPWRHSSGW